MKKYEVLKAVVVLQAVCMIVLAAVVIVRLLPQEGGASEADPGTPGKEAASADETVAVATVGGEPITLAEFRRELESKHGADVLRTMMVRKAIDLEAEAEGLQVSQEEQDKELASMIEGYDSEAVYFEVMKDQLGMTKEEVLDDLKYRLLLEKIATRSVQVTEEEIDAYIAEHRAQYGDRLQLHLSWIVTAAKEEAEALLERLEAGEDFAQLAKASSIDSFTAESGGDMGLIDADDPFYQADMMEAARRLQPEEIAGPFEVDVGFAIIRLTERQVTKAPSSEQLREQVRSQLAVSKAKPLNEVEDSLLEKYGAVQVPERLSFQ